MLEVLITEPSAAALARKAVASLAEGNRHTARLQAAPDATLVVCGGLSLDHLHPGDFAVSDLHAAGITSWTLAVRVDSLAKVAESRDRTTACEAARVPGFAGVFLVGPFVNGGEGTEGDERAAARLVEAAGGRLSAVVFAPECVRIEKFVPALAALGVRPIVGHTAAPYDLCAAAFSLGAEGLSLPFVATPPVHHREPGAIAAAANAGVRCEFPFGHKGMTPQRAALLGRLFGANLRPIYHPADCGEGSPDPPPADFARAAAAAAGLDARDLLKSCAGVDKAGTYALFTEDLHVLAVAIEGELVLEAGKAGG
ncbi:MAG: hypothetical protein ACYTAN_08045 [Planctomycetota bacterium]|jgi:hypothetical protein